MYQIGSEEHGFIPLCLDCRLKAQAIADRQIEDNERMLNYYAAQFDLAVGIPGFVPRFPERKRPVLVATGDLVTNNLKIDRSSIGVLNTGVIGSIDTAIGSLESSGNDQAAAAFRDFTEAVIKLEQIGVAERNELLELLSMLASEATVPDQERRKAAMRALLAEVSTICSGVVALTTLYTQYSPAIVSLFS